MLVTQDPNQTLKRWPPIEPREPSSDGITGSRQRCHAERQRLSPEREAGRVSGQHWEMPIPDAVVSDKGVTHHFTAHLKQWRERRCADRP
jgi:hypothetical protein